MTDKDLIARLRYGGRIVQGNYAVTAANRIEALVQERDDLIHDLERVKDSETQYLYQAETLAKINAEVERVAKWERDRAEALVRELAVSNELGRAFEEDAGQQRARAVRLEAALRRLLIAADGESYAEYFDAIEGGHAALEGGAV